MRFSAIPIAAVIFLLPPAPGAPAAGDTSILARTLAVPHPTLAATAAASDLDDLYGRMLLSNKHYGWERLLFQKNLARWKYWKPPDPQATRRLAQAEAAIAECDRRMTQ